MSQPKRFIKNIEIAMISKIQISNYKSIENLTLDLGRINVFIGENGAGKSNILEAITLAGAAASEKLDNEFLVSRGIRVTKPEFMRAIFDKKSTTSPVEISITADDGQKVTFELKNDNSPYSKWVRNISHNNVKADLEVFKSSFRKKIDQRVASNEPIERVLEDVQSFYEKLTEAVKAIEEDTNKNDSRRESKQEVEIPLSNSFHEEILQSMLEAVSKKPFIESDLKDFLIYSPENSSLRLFEKEGQIEPLGINGEGLLKLLHFHAKEENNNLLPEINKSLRILNWFENFSFLSEKNKDRLIIKDRYLDDEITDLDQKSANEGFLFLLFYFTLFSSQITPPFFAIDNIDASLNPKLCQRLVAELVKIAKNKNKQVILTTHNPAVLDGINLDDDEQRLFTISRGRSGATKLKRILKPVAVSGVQNYRLSELFIRGMLGGLPKGF